jgi:hypothetical protein
MFNKKFCAIKYLSNSCKVRGLKISAKKSAFFFTIYKGYGEAQK